MLHAIFGKPKEQDEETTAPSPQDKASGFINPQPVAPPITPQIFDRIFGGTAPEGVANG